LEKSMNVKIGALSPKQHAFRPPAAGSVGCFSK
jgi:hypothetical protein